MLKLVRQALNGKVSGKTIRNDVKQKARYYDIIV